MERERGSTHLDGREGGRVCVCERGLTHLDGRDGEESGGVEEEHRRLHFLMVLRQHQLPHRNVQRFRGGLVFKAHRLLYHSTLGLRVIKKKKNVLR